MGNVNSLLDQRLGKKKSVKMEALAKQSAEGSRTGFSGIFHPIEISEEERDVLEGILRHHMRDESTLDADLRNLEAISSEVKAINHQAALLHGERIKKAQQILKKYAEGAFTAWLIATYGNRQTPYNFLQYFEFFQSMPKILHPQIEMMPRQAIYTLASREGPLKLKEEIVKGYQGETKEEILQKIRDSFPLEADDRRKQNHAMNAIQGLKRVISLLARNKRRLGLAQREEVLDLIATIKKIVN